MNLIYASSAYPFGKLADKMSHAKLLALGLIVLIVADLVLAVNGHWSILLAGIALWGAHMGMTQGLLATMVADTAPADLRGRYMSVYWIGWGLARTLAPLIGGFLNDNIAPQAIWVGGLLIGLTSAFGLVTLNSITKSRAALRASL